MSDEDNARISQEFIDEAQRVMAQAEEMIAAIDKLFGNDGKQAAPRQPTPEQMQMEQELQALIARYIDVPDSAASPKRNAAARAPAPAEKRPGKYRPLV